MSPSFSKYQCLTPSEAETLYRLTQEAASYHPLTIGIAVIASISIILCIFIFIWHLAICSKRRRIQMKDGLRSTYRSIKRSRRELPINFDSDDSNPNSSEEML
nr:MAG: hypothetical protein [Wufeng shrew rhabdovirus 6]